MFKRNLLRTLAVILTTASILSLGNFLQTGEFSLIESAEAFPCYFGSGEVVEIYVTGPTWDGWDVNLSQTSGACKSSLAGSSDPRLVFTDGYLGDECQGYYTNQYDSSLFAGATLPIDVPVTLEAIGQDYGGECISHVVNLTFRIMPSDPTFTCSVSPTTHTVDPGSDYAYNVTSNAVNGFNSPVTYTASVTPDTAVKPVVSLPGSGQVPPGPTVATVTTTSSTTDDTYTITFTGTGGGETAVCSTEFIVNPPGPDFALTISPSTASVNKGDSKVYDVFASCTGGLAGPIDNMSATSSLMTGPILTLGSTSIPCGGTTTLTVSNTNLTNVQQLSDPSANAILNSITVIGRAQTN